MKFKKILLTLLLLFIPAAIINLIPLGGIPTFILYGIVFYFVKLVWRTSKTNELSHSELIAEESEDITAKKLNSYNSSQTKNLSSRLIILLIALNVLLVIIVTSSLYANYQLRAAIDIMKSDIDNLSKDLDAHIPVINNKLEALNDITYENRQKINEFDPDYGNVESRNIYGETVEEWRARKNTGSSNVEVSDSFSLNTTMVWVDNTAKRYHKNDSCGMDNAYQVTIEEAEKMGKTPCENCYQ